MQPGSEEMGRESVRECGIDIRNDRLRQCCELLVGQYSDYAPSPGRRNAFIAIMDGVPLWAIESVVMDAGRRWERVPNLQLVRQAAMNAWEVKNRPPSDAMEQITEQGGKNYDRAGYHSWSKEKKAWFDLADVWSQWPPSRGDRPSDVVALEEYCWRKLGVSKAPRDSQEIISAIADGGRDGR